MNCTTIWRRNICWAEGLYSVEETQKAQKISFMDKMVIRNCKMIQKNWAWNGVDGL